MWVQRFDGAKHYDDTSWGIAVTPHGSKVVVTGTSTDTDAGSDYVTIEYDTASGDQVWLGRYDGLVGSSDSALDATEDGVRMFVTGQSAKAGSFDTGIEIDMATVAYFDPWS